MNKNSKEKSLKNVEFETFKKYQSNEINSDDILRYVFKINSFLTLRIPEIEGGKIEISKHLYSKIEYNKSAEIYMPKNYYKKKNARFDETNKNRIRNISD